MQKLHKKGKIQTHITFKWRQTSSCWITKPFLFWHGKKHIIQNKKWLWFLKVRKNDTQDSTKDIYEWEIDMPTSDCKYFVWFFTYSFIIVFCFLIIFCFNSIVSSVYLPLYKICGSMWSEWYWNNFVWIYKWPIFYFVVSLIFASTAYLFIKLECGYYKRRKGCAM